MSKTYRRNRYVSEESKYVKDGEQTTELKNKKDQKRSTKKLRKLSAVDDWDIPNHDKFGRKAP